ncbi:MAG: Nif3-like dinuclear metal center hexameric protein [Saprospiraceae bacterium]|nr:Nif3-like dinuclear metal center hexameric protein [Saprospiraceae bacterium]
MSQYQSLFFLLLILSACSSISDESPKHKAISVNQSQMLSAGEIVSRIKEQVTCEWQKETVDTYKSGNGKIPVTGIATTFLATFDVLKRAQASGLNMIITHEPTYYNHLDKTEFFEGDAVFEAKKAFIEAHNLVVFRFHDHWHMTDPDGIHTGMIKELGWKEYQAVPNEVIFKLPRQTVGILAKTLKEHFKTPAIRVVGDPDMIISKVGMAVGASGSQPQIQMLRRNDVEVLIAGETHEWETVEWVRDAVTTGQNKCLILIGHANSEEAGMLYCAEWLKSFIAEVPIQFIEAGDPFWGPK